MRAIDENAAALEKVGVEPADLAADPIEEFGRWLDAAIAAELPEPTAMVLATADARGAPSARHVLLKGVDAQGFRWFTNYQSAKGRHLAQNPRGCLVFGWFAIGRQVVATGGVSELSAEESDAYFATRDRSSQLGAWASPQSEPVPDKVWLEHRVAEYAQRFAGTVPRPPHWGGYRLAPDTVEFWRSGSGRLHDRRRYERGPADSGWLVTRLGP